MFKIAKWYDNVTKTIRTPLPLAEQLERLAEENNISLNQCIKYALDNEDENKKDARR